MNIEAAVAHTKLMVVSILDSNELRYLSPHGTITVPDFLGEAQHLPKRFWHVPQSILAKSILNLPYHTEKWMKQIIEVNQNWDPMRVCTFEYVILVPFKLPIILSTSQLNQTNLPNEALDFCRGGCRAIVDSSSSHFTVPSEVAKGRVETPPQQKTLELKPGTSGNPKSNGEQYLDIFFCKWTHAKRQGRLKLSGKKRLNLSYPSLSGTLPPFKNYFSRPQRRPQCSVPYPIIATPASAADPQHTPQRWKPVTSLRAAHAWYSTIHFITEVTRN